MSGIAKNFYQSFRRNSDCNLECCGVCGIFESVIPIFQLQLLVSYFIFIVFNRNIMMQ